MNKNNRGFYAAIAIIGLFISGFGAQVLAQGLTVQAVDPVTGDVIKDITSEVNMQLETTAPSSTTLSTEANAAPVVPRSGGALKAGVDILLDATIEKDMKDGNAFCSALLTAFNTAPENIRTSYAWNKGSYATNLDANASLEGHQKELYGDVIKAYADANTSLNLISPQGGDAEYANTTKLATIVRSSMIDVAMEAKKNGGPDAARVQNLLALSSGALSCMPAKTVEESSNKEHYENVKDALVSLNTSWDEHKSAFGGTATAEEEAGADINIAYKEPAKFLGIFSSALTSKAVVHTDGSVSVKRPWYRFLFSQKTHMDEESVNNAIAEYNLNVKADTNVEARAQALEKLTNILNGNMEVETQTETSAEVE